MKLPVKRASVQWSKRKGSVLIYSSVSDVEIERGEKLGKWGNNSLKKCLIWGDHKGTFRNGSPMPLLTVIPHDASHARWFYQMRWKKSSISTDPLKYPCEQSQELHAQTHSRPLHPPEPPPPPSHPTSNGYTAFMWLAATTTVGHLKTCWWR